MRRWDPPFVFNPRSSLKIEPQSTPVKREIDSKEESGMVPARLLVDAPSRSKPSRNSELIMPTRSEIYPTDLCTPTTILPRLSKELSTDIDPSIAVLKRRDDNTRPAKSWKVAQKEKQDAKKKIKEEKKDLKEEEKSLKHEKEFWEHIAKYWSPTGNQKCCKRDCIRQCDLTTLAVLHKRWVGDRAERKSKMEEYLRACAVEEKSEASSTIQHHEYQLHIGQHSVCPKALEICTAMSINTLNKIALKLNAPEGYVEEKALVQRPSKEDTR